MSGILNIAISGLNNASARIANDAASIVNTSSTSPAAKNSQNAAPRDSVDLSASLIDSKVAQIDFGANAAAIKVAEKNQKTLIDITT